MLKSLSLGCLGDAFGSLDAARDILTHLRATPSVRTWLSAAPQLRGVLPLEVIIAFNRVVAAPLSKSMRTSIVVEKDCPRPKLTSRVVTAHPWKFWGECPGGIKPWKPVVVSPTQFHRVGLAGPAVAAILASRESDEPVYASELRQLNDTEHVHFPFPGKASLRLEAPPTFVGEADGDMTDLFASFTAMNFSPVRTMARRG